MFTRYSCPYFPRVFFLLLVVFLSVTPSFIHRFFFVVRAVCMQNCVCHTPFAVVREGRVDDVSVRFVCASAMLHFSAKSVGGRQNDLPPECHGFRLCVWMFFSSGPEQATVSVCACVNFVFIYVITRPCAHIWGERLSRIRTCPGQNRPKINGQKYEPAPGLRVRDKETTALHY